MSSEAFIISAVRSPIGIGKPTGKLAPIAPIDLTALLLQEVVRRASLTPEVVEDVILGVVTPVGDQGANLARLASLHAGFPAKIPGCQPEQDVRLRAAICSLCRSGHLGRGHGYRCCGRHGDDVSPAAWV
jgi:hypothetical protein